MLCCCCLDVNDFELGVLHSHFAQGLQTIQGLQTLQLTLVASTPLVAPICNPGVSPASLTSSIQSLSTHCTVPGDGPSLFIGVSLPSLIWSFEMCHLNKCCTFSLVSCVWILSILFCYHFWIIFICVACITTVSSLQTLLSRPALLWEWIPDVPLCPFVLQKLGSHSLGRSVFALERIPTPSLCCESISDVTFPMDFSRSLFLWMASLTLNSHLQLV